MQGKYSTVVSRYSLERGEIGRPIGEPTVVEYDSGPEALLALERELDREMRVPERGSARRLGIRNPEGVEQPFDATYEEVFGERPVWRDNKLSLYPRLNKYRK